MQSALDSLIGFSRRPTSASRMLSFLMPADVSSSFMCLPESRRIRTGYRRPDDPKVISPGDVLLLGTGVSESGADLRQAPLRVRRLVREQSVVRRVPRREPIVEASSPAEFVVDVPVCEWACQEVRVVESRVAYTHVAPIDHAGETPLVDEEMPRAQVGVDERRREIDACLDRVEEPPRLRTTVGVEHGEDEPFELRALFGIRLDPVVACEGKLGRIERMKSLEECTDSIAVLVDERLPADQAI